MLTTHQLVQTSTSYFFPTLLLIICWYSAASAIRSFSDLFVRLFYKRGVSRSIQRIEQKLQGSLKEESRNGETIPHGLHFQVVALRNQIKDLQEQLAQSLLLGHRATKGKLFLITAEGLLFSTLAVLSWLWATPVLQQIPAHRWWLHLIGIVFFLCFVLKIRRVILLLPLSAVAFVSWEVFSFITTFEKTLEATSTLAKVKVLQIYQPQKGTELPQVRLSLTFKNAKTETMLIPARQKLYFEGRFYRVSSEVLLFGGRNIATIDRVFSDVLPSENGVIVVKQEEIPPQYQWNQAQSQMPHLLPREKLSRWLWQQFFSLRKDEPHHRHKYVTMVPLDSVPCAPVVPGTQFEIRLRHVGGLECYIVEPEKQKGQPTTQPRNTHTSKIVPRNSIP